MSNQNQNVRLKEPAKLTSARMFLQAGLPLGGSMLALLLLLTISHFT